MKTKILYVEDEPFLGRIVKESLESRDFEVHMVADGSLAASTFEKIKPEICVLDIMLPKKDGYTIAKEIRKADPTMPIIFVTAKTQTEDLLKGFESGGNDYLRKPFSMEELIVRVNNLIKIANNGRSKTTSEKYEIGIFEFNCLRYELKNKTVVKKLSHREASLLQMMCENRNATVQRKDILLKLWGDDSYFNSRNLDVYITKLREYFREDPRVEIITIKGIGYQFTTPII
jgi:DNA-binding response OmpR family regulator